MMGKLGDTSVPLASANGSGGAPYKIDQNTFTKRLQALYLHWKKYKDELWGSADFYAVATPPPTEDICYLKSSTFNIWLLGYEFPDTIIVFGSKQIHFLCSQKNASLLEGVIGSAKEAVDVDVVIHAKLKDDDGTSKIDDVLHSIRMSKSEADDAPTVGYIVEESPEGSLLEKWADKLKTSGLQLSDVTDGLSDLFAVKDPNELTFAKKAAYLSASAMKNIVLSKLKRLADEEKKVTKSSLKAAVLDPARIKVKQNADNVEDICCPPSFQSGEKFDLMSGASRKDDYLFYDSPTVLICAIGSRYNNYCSSVARTFLIDANAFQRKAYKVLLKAHEAALNAVKPGNKVSDVYSAACAVVLMDAPDLEPNLAKMTAGTGIGLVRESGLGINLRNDQVIKAGFLYTISLGFQNMLTERGNPLKSRTFSLLLGDSVFVTNDGCNVITQLNSKDIKDVVYYSFSDTKKEELLEPGGKVAYLLNDNALYSKTTLLSDKQEISKEEELLQQRQHEASELAQEKNEDLIAARRLVVGGDYASAGPGDSWGAKLKASNELIGSRYSNYCSNVARHFLIDADAAFLRKAYEVLLRAHEAAISAVKSGNKLSAVYSAALAVVQMDASELVPNLTKTVGTRIDCLEFCKSSSGLAIDDLKNNDQLIKAGMVLDISLGFQNLLSETGNPTKCQIFSLLLGDRVHVTNDRPDVVTNLSSQADGVKNISAYTFDNAEDEVEPMLRKFKPIRLSDLQMYPPFDDPGRKMTGALEARANGFRYSTSEQDDEQVDIMLANIKHAFFQHAKKSKYTRLHFHLHNHMVVRNQKTKDLQFYIEVMDWDPDEIKKTNMDFKNFVDRVHEGLDLEFEQPQFKQGFCGEPSDRRKTAFIVPTKSCLVELTEIPFLVITLSEIGIVNLERIRRRNWGQKKQKDFDMAIVYNDMKRDVMVIRGIQPASLEGIKVWMKTSAAGIKSHKSRLNLNWRAILDTFLDDPQVFEDVGGWDFLNKWKECDSDYGPSGYEMRVPRNTRRKKRIRAVQKSEEILGGRFMLDGCGWVKILNA